MTIKEEVKKLLESFASEREIPKGASKDQIEEFSEYFITVPEELQEWLSLSNAPFVGGSGIFLGVKPASNFHSIESVYELFPDWEDLEWIPVAQDGCGNYYVLDVCVSISDTHPVYFIDHESNYNQPAYIVASGLWTFIFFILEQEMKKNHLFPFDKEYVLEIDPKLRLYKGDVLLPWQT